MAATRDEETPPTSSGSPEWTSGSVTAGAVSAGESTPANPEDFALGASWGLGHYAVVNSLLGALFITFIRALRETTASRIVDLGPDGIFGTADDLIISRQQDESSMFFLLVLGMVTGNCVGFSCLAIGKWLRPRWAHLQQEQRTLLYFLSFLAAGIFGAVVPLWLANVLQVRGASILLLCIGFVAAAVSLNIMIIEEMRERLGSYYRDIHQREQVERDLRVARLVQTAMFPREFPELEGTEVVARSMPAKEVGGDYYDLVPLADGRVLIAVADVAGKGLPAALLMSALRAGLRTLVDGEVDLPRVTGRLNRLIHEASDRFNYITFVVCILDPRTHQVEFVNAGHNPPVVLKADGTMHEESPCNLVLGFMPDIEYVPQQLQLEPGDLLVIYTDGMIEQHGLGDADFGLERLGAVIRAHARDPLERTLDLAFQAVSDFADTDDQYDDQTMVLVRAPLPRRRSTRGGSAEQPAAETALPPPIA